MNNIITLENIEKSFTQGKSNLKIFNNANLTIKNGEIVSLVGSSGCGKTTLLQIAGLLDEANSGKLIIKDIEIDFSKSKIKDDIKTNIRKDCIGFIYQFHNLLREFTAIENVMIPEMIKKTDQRQVKERALSLLTELGLENRANHFPAELSGGEQQRVAIARALIGNPHIILADEPTGNLDPNNAVFVMDYFIKIVRNMNVAALVVTHNIELAKKTDRVVTIKDGGIIDYVI